MSSYPSNILAPNGDENLSKVMVNRLCSHISKLIHPDQTGFLPGRQIYFNLLRHFNIMYHNHKEESLVIALDA